MENLNVNEAYRAMLCFIEGYLKRGNTDVESLFYSYAAPHTDGRTADPAAWSDWLDAVREAKEGRFGDLRPNSDAQG